MTCEHGTIGYCEKCSLRDPGELGEQKPLLISGDKEERFSDQQAWPQAGYLHCACKFYRAEDFGEAKLVTACAYHARREEALSATIPMTLIEAWKALPSSCREGATTGYETFDQRGRLFFTLACQFVKQAVPPYVGEK